MEYMPAPAVCSLFGESDSPNLGSHNLPNFDKAANDSVFSGPGTKREWVRASRSRPSPITYPKHAVIVAGVFIFKNGLAAIFDCVRDPRLVDPRRPA